MLDHCCHTSCHRFCARRHASDASTVISTHSLSQLFAFLPPRCSLLPDRRFTWRRNPSEMLFSDFFSPLPQVCETNVNQLRKGTTFLIIASRASSKPPRFEISNMFIRWWWYSRPFRSTGHCQKWRALDLFCRRRQWTVGLAKWSK